MRHVLIAAVLLALPTIASAQERIITTRDAAACTSYSGAAAFWNVVDRKPAGMTMEDWLDTIGCVLIRSGIEAVPLQNVQGIVLAILIGPDGPVEAWLNYNALYRNGEPYPPYLDFNVSRGW